MLAQGLSDQVHTKRLRVHWRCQLRRVTGQPQHEFQRLTGGGATAPDSDSFLEPDRPETRCRRMLICYTRTISFLLPHSPLSPPGGVTALSGTRNGSSMINCEQMPNIKPKHTVLVEGGERVNSCCDSWHRGLRPLIALLFGRSVFRQEWSYSWYRRVGRPSFAGAGLIYRECRPKRLLHAKPFYRASGHVAERPLSACFQTPLRCHFF